MQLFVANRGVARVYGPPKGKGSVSVIDFATRKVVTNWPIPGGGSPDMGNISVDGKMLWLSGRYDDAVYVIDTSTGTVRSIPVKKNPTASRSGHSPVGTRSAIPATCAECTLPLLPALASDSRIDDYLDFFRSSAAYKLETGLLSIRVFKSIKF
jgi:hypothetical protein